LHQEYDHYYSGKKYSSKFEQNGLDWESLTIRYDYVAAGEGKNPWQCSISCGPHFPEISQSVKMLGEVTFEEAEAILKEWGIGRLTTKLQSAKVLRRWEACICYSGNYYDAAGVESLHGSSRHLFAALADVPTGPTSQVIVENHRRRSHSSLWYSCCPGKGVRTLLQP
jgi:hypothetical protein